MMTALLYSLLGSGVRLLTKRVVVQVRIQPLHCRLACRICVNSHLDPILCVPISTVAFSCITAHNLGKFFCHSQCLLIFVHGARNAKIGAKQCVGIICTRTEVRKHCSCCWKFCPMQANQSVQKHKVLGNTSSCRCA